MAEADHFAKLLLGDEQAGTHPLLDLIAARPMASFKRWKELGRQVKKSEKPSASACPFLSNAKTRMKLARRLRGPISYSS
jgi:hypothetical protein